VLEFVELLVVLPKEGGHYWRALFEGGEEKSHMEVRTGVAPLMTRGILEQFPFEFLISLILNPTPTPKFPYLHLIFPWR
jgi:hypothetical protein